MSKKEKTLLWKIKGENIKTSYLFGTMHVRDARAFGGLDFLEKCINRCDVFAAEYNLEEGDAQKLQIATQLPEGITLASLLKPKRYIKLKNILAAETGYDIAMFNNSSPLLLQNVLAESQLEKEQDEPLDAALFTIAQRGGKKLAGLETFDGQMKVFERLDLKAQAKGLKDLVDNFKKYRKELKKMVELYVQGDIYKLYQKTKKTTKGLRKVLLYDRNLSMTKEFLHLAENQKLFAAVGAGHLAGKKGVLSLLKKEGFKVKPILY